MSSHSYDRVFAALADVNRRRVVEMLHGGESTLMQLSGSFKISFQALSKHIRVLEEAGIVTKGRNGKERPLRLNRDGLRGSLRWISYYSDFWNESFDKLEDLVGGADGDLP